MTRWERLPQLATFGGAECSNSCSAARRTFSGPATLQAAIHSVRSLEAQQSMAARFANSVPSVEFAGKRQFEPLFRSFIPPRRGKIVDDGERVFPSQPKIGDGEETCWKETPLNHWSVSFAATGSVNSK